MDDDQYDIHQVIIHKVDHKKYDEPQLSDLVAPLTPEVASFLGRQINLNYGHKHIRKALFIEPPDGTSSTRALCDGMFTDGELFIEHSRLLACHLFSVMDQRTSPGDLVACNFSDENSNWLALLKMTPQDGVVGEREVDDQGRVRYIFRPVAEVLPTGELQKCAFIVSPEGRDDSSYHLRVLDQQAAGQGIRRLVASFFIKDFLQCKIDLNRADKTRNFIMGSNEWILRKRDAWEREAVERFQNRVLDVVENNIVDLDDVAEEVIANPEEQQEYINYMQEQHGMDELTFRPDPAERERRTRYTIITGDHRLRIRITTEAFRDDETVQVSEPDSAGMRTITIRTSSFEVEHGKSR